jgi:hypothetical protein
MRAAPSSVTTTSPPVTGSDRDRPIASTSVTAPAAASVACVLVGHTSTHGSGAGKNPPSRVPWVLSV